MDWNTALFFAESIENELFQQSDSKIFLPNCLKFKENRENNDGFRGRMVWYIP